MNRFAIDHPPAVALAVVASSLAIALTRSSPPRPPPPPVQEPYCVLHALPPVPVPAPQPMPIEASPAPDLDGDGVAERFDEVPDSCGTGGCVYRVFFTSRGGDRFVGEIAGHWPFEIDRRRGKAPADVIATWRLGATESMASRYVFKRGGYVEHSESHCEGDACTAEHLVRR